LVHKLVLAPQVEIVILFLSVWLKVAEVVLALQMEMAVWVGHIQELAEALEVTEVHILGLVELVAVVELAAILVLVDMVGTPLMVFVAKEILALAVAEAVVLGQHLMAVLEVAAV
jgi:hypothetical protein